MTLGQLTAVGRRLDGDGEIPDHTLAPRAQLGILPVIQLPRSGLPKQETGTFVFQVLATHPLFGEVISTPAVRIHENGVTWLDFAGGTQVREPVSLGD